MRRLTRFITPNGEVTQTWTADQDMTFLDDREAVELQRWSKTLFLHVSMLFLFV